ncbi:MAG: phenylalanine--tRNA ligase subunit beta [Sedimentisphaerales bacterium]|nr:phenylalanine--tRNA ligase subunit beta [Sedimentisphaerales bacterium]
MKISLDWLKNYVQIDQNAESLAETLSDLGFPTESIEYLDGDTVIDIEVTSNRGDCLSHIGIAREIAAAGGGELQLPEINLPQDKVEVTDFVAARIDCPDLCKRYTARIITGIKVGPSPDWMKKRLEAVGVRSVNNVVDATNYAMMETGQPPHAFDYDKLSGKQIIVRKAVKGEKLISIDETKCDLDESMLIIADADKPVAIAGVMGGLDTEVSETTTTILLEDAHFDPVTVRTTGRKLGISSESSFRFERHVDVERIDWASQRTAQLIIEVAGGKAAKGVADAYPCKPDETRVQMRLSRLNSLLGIDIDSERAVGILAGLDLKPNLDGDVVTCTVPSWRHDIYREADLIEEVARGYGYGNIPVQSKVQIEVARADKREKVSCKLRNYLNGCGFYETINISFTDAETAEVFSGGSGDHISVKDDSRKSANMLRQTLIGSLLNVLKSNYNAGNIPCRIFEIADTFEPSGQELPIERTKISLAVDGDFRQLRGVIEGLASVINSEANVEIKPAEFKWAQAAGQIFVSGKQVGFAGVVSEQAVKKMDLPQTVISVAELDLQDLLDLHLEAVAVKPLPRFPSIKRDLSLVVDEPVSWADITGAIAKKATDELEDVVFAGIYRGKPIDPGKKSVTASLVFRDEEGTLKHETVDQFENSILNELKNSLGAELRAV